MTVVSNTSPINYLTLIGLDRLLPALFGRVIIPLAVQEELKSPGAPPQIREMFSRSEGWLEAVSAPSVSDPVLAGLDAGEMEAIGLAVQMKVDLVLLDEARGRRAASEHFGLPVTGTLGVLDRAARLGLIDVADAVVKLRKTSFRASPKINFSSDLLPLATKTSRKQAQKPGSKRKEVIEKEERRGIRREPEMNS